MSGLFMHAVPGRVASLTLSQRSLAKRSVRLNFRGPGQFVAPIHHSARSEFAGLIHAAERDVYSTGLFLSHPRQGCATTATECPFDAGRGVVESESSLSDSKVLQFDENPGHGLRSDRSSAIRAVADENLVWFLCQLVADVSAPAAAGELSFGVEHRCQATGLLH